MSTEISEQNFDTEVLQSDKPVLVDFHAPWCAPCVQQAPVLEEWAAGKADIVSVAKVNVDNAPAIASRFGVMSIPTIIVFKNGKECARAVGLRGPGDLDKLIQQCGD